jgi:hypothetical protein
MRFRSVNNRYKTYPTLKPIKLQKFADLDD